MPPELIYQLREGPDEFLNFLRALMLMYNADAKRLPTAIEDVRQLSASCDGLAQARSMKLITGDLPNVELTSLGKQVCDGVKQYCNWTRRSDELPPGVELEAVRGKSILDVGCGVGCALLTFGRHGASQLAGLDMMPLFPAMAREFAARQKLPAPIVVLGDGAALPFQDGAFDLVFCRLAINYMRSHQALAEMARVTRPGAEIVICLNTLRWHIEMLRGELGRRNWRAVGFDMFRFVNGTLFHLTGKQMTLRFKGRMHAVHSPVWHTPGTMIKHMKRWGFETIWHDADTHPATPTFRAKRCLV